MSAASRSIATADALGRPGVQSVGASVDFTPMVAGGRRSLFETARLLKENNHGAELSSRKAPFDIDALLHPSKTFRHPLDVVRDTDMTVAEKRSVLASWASDACAPRAAGYRSGECRQLRRHHRCAAVARCRLGRGHGDLRVQAPAAAQTMERLERPRTRRAGQRRPRRQRVRLSLILDGRARLTSSSPPIFFWRRSISSFRSHVVRHGNGPLGCGAVAFSGDRRLR
jgi:hypothetical protein